MSWASIWDVLTSERERLLGKDAHVECNFEDYMKKVEKALGEKKERRNVRFNMARLDPFASSIPNDSISSTRAESSAKYHFYNKAEDCFEAPETWPHGENLLIGVLSPSIGKAGTDAFRIYGKQHVRDGFWWAYAMAMTAEAGAYVATHNSDEAKKVLKPLPASLRGSREGGSVEEHTLMLGRSVSVRDQSFISTLKLRC